MSGIDLCASLGLDRSADPATLAAELDRRISSSGARIPRKSRSCGTHAPFWGTPEAASGTAVSSMTPRRRR